MTTNEINLKIASLFRNNKELDNELPQFFEDAFDYAVTETRMDYEHLLTHPHYFSGNGFNCKTLSEFDVKEINGLFFNYYEAFLKYKIAEFFGAGK